MTHDSMGRMSLGGPPRFQAFEFGDQPWLTGVWREAYLDGLDFVFRVFGVYGRMHEPFRAWAAAAGNDHVLDLGSGSGAPVQTMLANAAKEGRSLPRVSLSDLKPDIRSYAALKAAHPGRIDYVDGPCDAASAQFRGAGLVSICTAFHHFPPPLARKILANAAAHSDGLFIAEVMKRDWLSLIASIPCLLPLMLASFFSARPSFKKILITTVFPIIPLMIVFDGTVSALRGYRNEEILAMVPEAQRRGWHWTHGELRYLGFLSISYIHGHRVARQPATLHSARPQAELAART